MLDVDAAPLALNITGKISDTAKWGELTVGPEIIGQTVQKRMRSALRDIRSGKFAREFIREMETGARRRAHLLCKAEAHPIKKAGARLRSLMRWKSKTKCSPRCRVEQRAARRTPVFGGVT